MPVPAFAAIADTQVDPGKPATSALAYAFRDNLLAVLGGGVNAPSLFSELSLSAPAANAGQYLRVSTVVHPVDTPRKLIEYVAGGGTIYHDEGTSGSVTTYTRTLTLPTTGVKKVTITCRQNPASANLFVVECVLDAANQVIQAIVTNSGGYTSTLTMFGTALTSDTVLVSGASGFTLKVTGTSIGLKSDLSVAAIMTIAIQAMVF
jgi:hypothetical protein